MSDILDKIKPQAAIAALDELEKSLGWALVQAYLDKDMMNAVRGMGSNPDMSEKELHFRRGAIHATDGFSRLPSQLSAIFTANVALEQRPEHSAEGDH